MVENHKTNKRDVLNVLILVLNTIGDLIKIGVTSVHLELNQTAIAQRV